MSNTFKQWIELQSRSFTDMQEFNFVNQPYDDTQIDLSKIIPSLEFFDKNNITILDEPFYIMHETDLLGIRYHDLWNLRKELEEYSHVYSFKLTRAVHSEKIFDLKIGVVIRGVRKENLTDD